MIKINLNAVSQHKGLCNKLQKAKWNCFQIVDYNAFPLGESNTEICF